MRVSVLFDPATPLRSTSQMRDDIGRFLTLSLDCARMLDSSAVCGIFVPERHARPDCLVPAPLEHLVALASVTSRVRLGTYVLMPPLHAPAPLLERLAIVDHLSGGRLVCGLGVGFDDRYFDAHEQSIAERGRRMDNFLGLLHRAWSEGEPREADPFVPPPQQRPRPPIWIGGSSVAAVERAARYGDALALGFTDRRTDHWIELYRAACQRLGRPPSVVVIRSTWTRREPGVHAEARDLLGELLTSEASRYRDRLQVEATGTIDYERVARHAYIGDPDTIVHRIREDGARWGLSEIVLRVPIAMGDPNAALDCVRVIGEVIAPALEEASDTVY